MKPKFYCSATNTQPDTKHKQPSANMTDLIDADSKFLSVRSSMGSINYVLKNY